MNEYGQVIDKGTLRTSPGNARQQREDPLDRPRPVPGSRIPAVVRREIEKSTRLTEHNTGLNFTVAFDYGGRQELVGGACHCGDATRTDRHRDRAPSLYDGAAAGRPDGPNVG